MTRWSVVLSVVLGLLCFNAHAQAQDGKLPSDGRQRLIEQKLRLVESLLGSPVAQAAIDGQEVGVAELVLNGRRLLSRARANLVDGQLDAAGAAADEALRDAAKISALASNKRGTLSVSVQQTNYKNLTEQVATYRSSLEELARQGNADAKNSVARIKSVQDEASKLVDAGKWGDANRKLADAYKMAVEIISRLRAGQTVTLSLKFDTPAEEYEYERRRFQSGEILVDMMIGEGRAEGERRTMVDRLVGEGKQHTVKAADLVRSGEYKAAVTTMENATKQLHRALQIMGVPVF